MPPVKMQLLTISSIPSSCIVLRPNDVNVSIQICKSTDFICHIVKEDIAIDRIDLALSGTFNSKKFDFAFIVDCFRQSLKSLLLKDFFRGFKLSGNLKFCVK